MDHSSHDWATTQLSGPGDFITPTTTISFDDVPHHTIVNNQYVHLGAAFSEDEGGNMLAYGWSTIPRVTTSAPNVLASPIDASVGATGATHVNITFSSPVTEVGAYFGNDQGDHIHTGLTLYDNSNSVIDTLSLAVNNNTSVDQFIGLRSTIPFVKVRFENIGDLTVQHSIVIDDLTFTIVPEPSAILVIAGILSLMRCSRHVRTVN